MAASSAQHLGWLAGATPLPTLFALTALFCALHAPSATAADYADAGEFLAASKSSNTSSPMIATGDLTSDGKPDLAVLVETIGADGWTMEKLSILMQNDSGRYEVAASSTEQVRSGTGCCWIEDLEIRKGSVFVQHNAKTACNIEAATHQFQLREGRWRAIGSRIFYLEHCDVPELATTQDVNLLTGKSVHSREVGGKVTESKTKRLRLTPAYLDDYDFSHDFGLPKG